MTQRPLNRAFASLFCLTATAVGTAGMVASANAQESSSQTLRQACRSDYQTFCSGTPPGGGGVIACLEQHTQSLSSPCQQALAATQNARQNNGQGS